MWSTSTVSGSCGALSMRPCRLLRDKRVVIKFRLWYMTRTGALGVPWGKQQMCGDTVSTANLAPFAWGSRIVVESQVPITLLAAYSTARGLSSVSQLSDVVGCTRQQMSAAYNARKCSKPLADLIYREIGLPPGVVCWMETRTKWTLNIRQDGKAELID